MNRLFGTNGIRGIPGKNLTPQFCTEIGLSVGTYFSGRKIAVGGDTRLSTPYVKSAVISGLIATGCDVIDLGVLPTPALQYYCKTHGYPGVMITASHNPPEYNGIKVVGSDGTEIPRNEEIKIEEIFFQKSFKYANWQNLGKITERDAKRVYIEAVVKSVDAERIKKGEFTVALDCGNGAGCFTSPYILDKLGVRVFSLNCNPDGRFPARMPEPREENLSILKEFVSKEDLDFGAAHDGDADRVNFIDEKGNFVHGDVLLAIFARYFVRSGHKVIVTPVSTSRVVEDIVKMEGGEVVYTKVGAPIVARKMREIRAKFGGEENGGFIFGDFQYCRDGGYAIAKLLEIISREDRSVGDLVSEIPRYVQRKISVKCPENLKSKVLEILREALKDENPDLTDGVKISGEDFSVLMRPSGTEEIYRIYAEAKSEEKLNSIIKKYKKVLEDAIEDASRGN